jgi:hypothetical protein
MKEREDFPPFKKTVLKIHPNEIKHISNSYLNSVFYPENSSKKKAINLKHMNIVRRTFLINFC